MEYRSSTTSISVTKPKDPNQESRERSHNIATIVLSSVIVLSAMGYWGYKYFTRPSTYNPSSAQVERSK